MNELDVTLNQLAEHQHGLLTLTQAREQGASRSALHHRVRSGAWVPVGRGVLRRAGSPVTDRQVAMAATLLGGSVLSHRSAAALWGLPGFRLLPVQTTHGRSGGYHRPPVAGLHRTTYLPPHHVTSIDGIPVLTPSRLLFQLAAWHGVARMARLTDTAWSRRLVSGRSLHAMCDELSEHGRDGMGVMREVLQDRPVGYVPPESALEARLQQVAREHDLPEMRRQVDLGDREWLGRVDFLAVDCPLIVLVDGEHWHSSRLDRAADARQQAELEAAGFVVVRITEFEVWHDVPAAITRIRAGWRLARLRAG